MSRYLLVVLALSATNAFIQPAHQSYPNRGTRFFLSNEKFWFVDSLRNVFGKVLTDTRNQGENAIQPNLNPLEDTVAEENSTLKARVVRLAARSYDKDSSTPSSRNYTTRKDAVTQITVTSEGVLGDYNHYRTVALQSTPSRAVSLLTIDSMKLLKSLHSMSQDGDLGENILVDGVTFFSLKVGDIVRIGNDVLLEITEPMEPCANLCKLPYINRDGVDIKKRVENCKNLINKFSVMDGQRGWYAKVIRQGAIHLGDVLQVARG